MGTFTDLYSVANFWYGGAQHVVGAKEDTGWAMAGIGADFVGFMQPVGRAVAQSLGATRAAAAAETPIIEAALLAMMAMSNACGFGEPETGNRFGHGSESFDNVSKGLDSSQPPAGWQGTSSEAYSDRNNEQKQRAADMATTDQAVQAVLDKEAKDVKETRSVLDQKQTILTFTIPIAIAAMAIEIPPGAGVLASMAIQAAAVTATLPFAIDSFENLTLSAAQNATQIRRAGASYDQIASAAHPS